MLNSYTLCMLHEPLSPSQSVSQSVCISCSSLEIIRIFLNLSQPSVNIPGGELALSSRSIFRVIDLVSQSVSQTEKLDKT